MNHLPRFASRACLAAVLAVAAEGGAEDFPVAEPSSEALRAAVEASRAAAPAPRRVLLPPGTIRLEETLVLGREDEGLTLESADLTQPCWIIGSTLLNGNDWRPAPEAEGRPLWEARIPPEWPEPLSLYFEGQPLPRARSRGYVQRAEPPEEMPYRYRRAIDGRHLYLPPEALREIPGLEGGIGAEVRVVPFYPWTMMLLPLTRLDREHGLAWSAVPGIYPLKPPAFGRFPDGSLWVENLPGVLDQPGEWCYEPAGRRLLLWTPDGGPPGDRVEAPRLTELVRIEGEVDHAALEDKPARGITLRGISFARANAWAWEEGKTGWGLQHDWEMYDRPTAMVRLRGAEDCLIESCRFVNSGAAGLRLDLHCQGNVARHCEFTRLGGTGVLLAGYGMGYKDVNRGNEVSDCTLRHVGEHWWHSPAIFLWQSGRNRVIHNRIHDVPYSGIVVSTRTQISVSGDRESSQTARMNEVLFHLEGRRRTWDNREELMHGRHNLIAWNDISRVMQVMGDGNAIYISGTGTGNRVERNFIRDITSPNMNAAIRCDDDQHEVTVSHNVIARVTGEGLVWKGRCDVVNNLVFALRSRTPEGVPATHQRGFLILSGEPVEGSVVQRNIFYGTEPRFPILLENDEPWERHGRPMAPVTLASCEADRNLYWNPANPLWAEDHLAKQRSRGAELGSVSADPLLASPRDNDFTFPPDSPAAALGIEPLDVSAAGPRPFTDGAPSAR